MLRELGLFNLKKKKARGMANCSLQLIYTENKGNSSQKYRTKRQEAMAASCKRQNSKRNKENIPPHKGDSALEHMLKEAEEFPSLELFKL